jgi:ABC-2 type transport system ATP-binding protein
MKDAPDTGATAGRTIARVGGEQIVISARRLSYWYGQVIGINDISLDIGQGVVGLLGPNGAGKSTLFKVITGQLRPRTGTVAIFGQKVWNNPSVFSQIGFVPEQDAFYEEMTGRQFVTYLTRLQGFAAPDAARLADEAIAQVDLQAQADRSIQEYSKGMRQRIKIAQALAHKPRVLFLDEPLTGTDPVGRRHIIDLIKKLGDDGVCVLVSSHILHEVEQMTSDILLINKGRILAEGNVLRIREMIDEHPHTIFVGCDAPRKLAALLASHDDILRIEFVEGGFRVATSTPDACYRRIPKLALDHGIKLQRMTSPDNNLTAVFQYLVR